MRFTDASKIVAAFAFSTWATAACSHVTLQDPLAGSGATYRAVLRVGHGCDGSSTVAMRVTIPAGFNGAQPMVKPGWKLSTKVGVLAEPYVAHGTTFTEGVQEITWTANTAADALPDALYDEFVLRGTPKKAGPLWFKVEQLCEKGSNPWVEVPASGTSTKGLKMPAALLEVIDLQPSSAHSH
ncbi:YcnI family protein [Curvibacter sp. APW13]|uniref:YcnI family copper-binding membrane protein n=1 Tax=Curvibacter sp. APW13 TaxID=3077236 RepID=UPI0028DDAB7B|nr:YcnI family protein [Curvibacter sp. APW13]MDT8990820.1 YcnI family protein [Curvibacter sp. APW13]